MIAESEINRRAGEIADTVVEMLTSDRIFKAAVVVTQGFAYDYPLAVRTPQNNGFGSDTITSLDSQAALLQIAKLQANYAIRSQGRSAREQNDKVITSERQTSSYGLELPSDFLAAFAHDKLAKLTVVASLEDKTNTVYASRIAEKAISRVSDGKSTQKIQEAAKLLKAGCNELVKLGLPDDRTGFCMITHPLFKFDPFKGYGRDALVICSQAVGKVVEPANYKIVAAKAGTVAITSKPSGPGSSCYKGVNSQNALVK